MRKSLYIVFLLILIFLIPFIRINNKYKLENYIILSFINIDDIEVVINKRDEDVLLSNNKLIYNGKAFNYKVIEKLNDIPMGEDSYINYRIESQLKLVDGVTKEVKIKSKSKSIFAYLLQSIKGGT